MSTQLGVVHWRSRMTGYEGHGQPMPIDQARDVAELGNRKYHMKIDHWVVVQPFQQADQSKACQCES